MKLSSQKVIAGLIGVATILTLVVGVVTPAAAQVSTTVTSSTTGFTRNLTIGSTGADVTALQQLLETAGFFTVTPTGYFGPITQKALAAYQASVGISPAAGYFGQITMGYIAAHGGSGSTTTTTTTSSGVPGCAAGATYSATTGAPCTSSSSVPGCAAGAMFSATTGAPCTAGNTTLPAGCVAGSAFSSTTGVACTATSVTGNGVLTVTQDPSVVTNTNVTNYTNVPLYGLQLQSQLGSVSISQLTLAVTDTLATTPTASNENPGAFISSISIVDPSTNTVIYTEPVTPANFISNPSNGIQFYIQLSGFNLVVPANTTKFLVVEANTASSIDLQRTLVVSGYSTNGLQYFTGNNIVNYQNISNISVTSTFSTPSNVSLVLGIDASNPNAATNYVNSSSGAQGVILLAFNAQSSSGNVTITGASTTVTTTGTAPTAIYLYNGSTLLSEVSPTNASTTAVTFSNNFSSVVSSGSTKVYTIRADFPSNTSAGTVASTTLNGVTYTTSGSQIVIKPATLQGNNQTFYAASPNITFVSATTPVLNYNNGANSAATGISSSITLSVAPQPGSELQPVAGDFTIKVGSSTAANAALNGITATIGTPIITPTPVGTNPLSNGQTYTVVLNASIGTTSLTHGNFYAFYLTSASTTVNNSSGSPVQQTLTSGLSNFLSPSVLY